MALAGAKPKDGPTRHRNPVIDWTEFENVPFEGPSPELPDAPYGRNEDGEAIMDWDPQTREWYETARRLPHAVAWGPGEWLDAIACARLLDRFIKGTNGVAPELRIRQKEIGMTATERRDLRIRYVDPKPETPTTVDSPGVTPIRRGRPATNPLDV